MTIASALARTAAALAGAAMLGLIVPGVFAYVADDLARR